MINFKNYTNENQAKQFKVVMYSRSSIQNGNKRRFWIWKNKCIIQFIKHPADIDKIYLYEQDPNEKDINF